MKLPLSEETTASARRWQCCNSHSIYIAEATKAKHGIKLLKRISLSNFKGLSTADIELSKLNLFVGENGTGKSSVIQGLSILKRSMGGNAIITDLPYLNLGQLTDIVAPGQISSIGIEGNVPVDLTALNAENADFKCTVKFDAQGLFEYETEISPNWKTSKLNIHNVWTRYGVSKIEPKSWQYEGFVFGFGFTNSIGLAFAAGGFGMQRPMSSDQAAMGQRIHASLVNLSQAIRVELERTYVVPTTRGLTEPVYLLQPNATSEFSPRAGPIPMGTALATNLTYNRHNQDKIDRWQKEILGVGVEYHLEPGPSIFIRNPDNKVNYVNEGFGSNQMLFVFERIANSPEDSLIAIEEPEIHVHPKAQFKLGLVASEIVKEEKKQLLLITHSEHVVSGVLTAIRNEKLQPQEVSLWFFEKKGLKHTATRSEIDKEGKTSGALKSFLEAALGELSDYVKSSR